MFLVVAGLLAAKAAMHTLLVALLHCTESLRHSAEENPKALKPFVMHCKNHKNRPNAEKYINILQHWPIL